VDHHHERADDPPAGSLRTRPHADSAETVPPSEGVPVSLAEEFLTRARIARDRHGGHPPAQWSTGEQSAVALLFSSRAALEQLDMTPKDACVRLADDLGMSPHQARGWVYHYRELLRAE